MSTTTEAPGAGRPRAHPLGRLLAQVHADLAADGSGEVATYIPELGRADPSAFGLSVVTADGRAYAAGDAAEEFTIQSVSKPFIYALAMLDAGRDHVLARVGTEPTGEAFNSTTLEAGTGRPLNPMVNAGAILTASLVGDGGADARFARILAGLSAFAGRSLGLDEAVLASEARTGDRNRALAHLMRAAGSLEAPVDLALDVYFRQCAVLVSCTDLAVMGATLAAGGLNPVTGEQVVPAELVSPVLSVMSTCGMYDAAGTWLFRVGLPAKSGVGGGVVAVLPGQLGIGAWSPPLDVQGNSVRAVRACEALSARLDLHLLAPAGASAPPVRRWTDGRASRSLAARTVHESGVLDRQAHRLHVVELQGGLTVHAAESVSASLGRLLDDEPPTGLVLDATHLAVQHGGALDFVHAALLDVAAAGATVRVVDRPRGSATAEPGGEAGPAGRPWPVTVCASLDQALEQVEDAVLRTPTAVPAAREPGPEPFAGTEVLEGLGPEALAEVARLLVTRTVPDGAIVLESGSAPDGLRWVRSGRVDVRVPSATPGRWTRVNGVGAGGVLGELSLVTGGPRSARVVAVGPCRVDVLDGAAVDRLEREHPAAHAALMRGVARLLALRLRHATRVIQSLQA